jgi:hypothetical protein
LQTFPEIAFDLKELPAVALSNHEKNFIKKGFSLPSRLEESKHKYYK